MQSIITLKSLNSFAYLKINKLSNAEQYQINVFYKMFEMNAPRNLLLGAFIYPNLIVYV